MDTKTILTRGIEVVTFLFAGFGSFLLGIAPPGETDSQFAVGASSMLALFVLLFIPAVTKDQPLGRMKKVWLSVSLAFFVLAIIASIVYKGNLDKLTFAYPPGEKRAEHIAGTIMTPDAERFLKDNPSKAIAEIVAAFEGPAYLERVWTAESIRRSKLILTANYVVVVLATAIMLFGLTEGILVVPKST